MIKRILSLLLAFLMVFSMVPAQALAAAGAETSEQKAPEEMTISACPTCGQQDCVSEHTDWCTICMKDDCGTDHSAIIDAQPCDKCGSTECSGHENWCDLCKTDNCGKDHGETKDQTQVLFSKQVNAVSEDEPHPMEGKLVQFIKDFPTLWDRPDGTESLANKKLLPSVMRVVKVETDSKNRTLYLLEAVEGTWDSYYEGYYYANSTQMEEIVVKEPCPVCGETDCTTEHKQCGICGEYDCAQLHFFCEICQNYTCTQAHLICPACGTVDCEKTHIWCGICADYDCGMTHENEFKPNTKPVIPDDPTLTPGEDVSILDEYGDVVTEDGLYLAPGMRISLSAWGDPKATGAAYQWQIRYNETRNLWVDIQGQTGKGILISPAMFLSVIEESGSAAIRCRVTSGGETKISAAIPVTVVDQQMTASFGLRSGSVPYAEDENGNGEDLQKSYVVVQYVYADGRTAASGDFAEVIPGTAINYDYTLPTIPGYKATLENAGAHASVKDGVLTVTYAEGELAAGEYEQIKVVYQPDYVRYTIIHYWQNVGDDRYTEHEREVIDFYDSDLSDNDRAHKTGEVIANAHKSYPGFYNLLYETPAAAADGSTVIEVYYDRYYYLMKFDLGDMGYGVDPIYARTGAEIEIGTPTRKGYTFQGWKLNGVDAEIPAEMPPESRTYTAKWLAAEKVTVNVVIWGENPDDEGYSYQKTIEIEAKPGDTISWDTYCFNCGKAAHTHNALCGYNCGQTEHMHNSGCYTLTCTTKEHTSHTDSCYACGRQEHTEHTDECCENGGTSLTHWWHSNGCCTLGGTHTHSSSCGYKCTLHTHSMTEGCYTATCGKVEHPHTDDCGYACGVTAEHVHTSACGNDQSGLKNSLWTLVRSDTVTVDAAGNTVMNVYYDRTEFTLTFRRSNSTVKTITDKWGADIHGEFPIKNGNNTMWWTVPSGCSSMKPGTEFGSLDTMPAENITFTYDDETQAATLHYYVEALPGEDGRTASGIYNGFTGNGIDGTKKFKSYKDINVTTNGYLTYTEEFHNINGFRQYVSYPQFNKHEQGGQTNDIKKDNYLLYARNTFDIVFYNPTDLIKTQEDVPYQMPLSSYYWEPTSADAPDIYEPGSVQFAGWYLNPEGTGTRFDFTTNTMPAGPNNKNSETALALYAKWEPVSYRVNYYLSDKSLERNENIPAEMDRLIIEGGITKPANDPYTEVFAEDIVKHGGYLEDPGEPGVAEGYKEIHPFAGYEFIGWFYLDEEGTENAFDPANIPVHSDLNLYAKWSSNTLCYYNVYFALDVKNNTTGAEGADGIADVDANGNVIYIADPVSGSAIAGRTYTFPAKGGEELYDPVGDVNYRVGYFPTVGSHSITIDIADTDGTGANSYTFLYRPKDAIPYTVKYVVKETGECLFDDKVVSDNKNVVVTENFKYKQGYMPEKYQITLIVTDDDNKENDVIIFYYTKDEQHALYVINYYIQDLNEDLSHKGWSKYDDMQSTGTIGESYVADAITIDGFTLSKSYTDGYNRADNPINGMTGASLPSTPIGALTDGKLSGKLSDKGMELNFYYTRNLYPYEFRYMLNGTTTKLAESEFGMAGYDTYVTGVAREIVMDLDGDGINEDYRLYDPTEVTKDIHIIKDGDPLPSDHVVTEGQATVNVATFYYVRCTQTMTITKEVVDEGLISDPNPDQEFAFSLLIHAKNGYHRTEYTYQITEGEKLVESGTLSPVPAAPNTLQFTLKAGQKITIEGLPTAEYTVSERNLPVGYYDDQYSPEQKNKLTVNGQLDVTVRNTYDPALLSIKKTVDVVEDHDNIPEIQAFAFTITVPNGVTGSYGYTIGTQTHTATVSDGSMTIKLENGQTATFQNLPVGTYTVTETDYSAYGYDSSYKVNASASYTEGQTATIATVRGTTQTAEFLNKFPVGDLNIEKTVSKEFYGTVWNGDTFTFSVERTTAGRPLKDGNKYDVYEGETKVATATVEDGKLVVTMTFDAENAAAMDEASEQNVFVTRTLVIKNLPAGTYSVVENANSAYVQTPIGLKVENLVIPAEEVTASFANMVKRGAGNLRLEKELEVLDGYQRPAEVTKFSFTIELLECVPEEEITVAVAYSPAASSDGEAAATPVTMSGGSFTVTLEAGQTVQIQGLPEGKYRITEETIPYYANSFAHKENGSWAVQPSTTTDQGQMYTEIGVANGETAEVKCTNTYPVDKAELIIQKVVTKEYKRDTLPDNSFTFTVTLEEDDVSSYAYKIYNADGSVAAEAAADVENRAFSIVLKAGQYAVIPGMPVCGYTVHENVDTANFNASYAVYVYETGEAASAAVDTSGVVNASGTGASASRTFSAGKTDAVVFTNKYKRHLGTLTVNKTVIGSSGDDVFIFHIKGTDTNNSYIDMDVTIEGNSSVTVYDLPLGTYSVTEDISWSWRYTADVVTKTVNLSDDPDAEVDFTNTYRENRWLNYYTDLPNTFGKKKEENEGS